MHWRPRTDAEWRLLAAQLLYLFGLGVVGALVLFLLGESLWGSVLLVLSAAGIVRAVHILRR